MNTRIPLGEWVDAGVKWFQANNGGVVDFVGRLIEEFTLGIEQVLGSIPWWALVGAFIALGFWRKGWQFALFTAAAFGLIVSTGFWDQTVVTLALITSATVISLAIGVPVGIWAAKSPRVEMIVRPVLDFMQTMPAFVYLIPAAMMFGLGKVPGVLATVVFAMPPAVRLTTLGIRQVNKEQVEAGISFGCTPFQLLRKVQIPSAMPSILAGVNQTIMMARSMVIIASMVGAGGLGNDVLAAISRLDVGLGFESGLCVVLLAIVLDRLTESFGQPKSVT